MNDTTDPQSQQEYRFEVAIPFGTEPYRNPTYLPDVLNPWRYRAKRRVQNISENTIYKQWGDWNLNANDVVPGEFTPYVVQGRKTDNDQYIYEWMCKVDISASDSAEAHARIERGLSTVVDEQTIRPFEGERFMAQVGSAQFGGWLPR